jgi:hypothetical protein
MDHPQPDPTRPPLLLSLPSNPPTISPVSGQEYGHPGASAITCYRRRRAAEWTLYQRTIPLRLAGLGPTALVVALVTHEVAPGLAGWAAAVVVTVLGWQLRFRGFQGRPELAARRPRGAPHRSPAPPASTSWLGGVPRPRRPQLGCQR